MMGGKGNYVCVSAHDREYACFIKCTVQIIIFSMFLRLCMVSKYVQVDIRARKTM